MILEKQIINYFDGREGGMAKFGQLIDGKGEEPEKEATQLNVQAS